jgi:anti-sigma-K factor RskA
MMDEALQDQAADYVSGGMEATEAERFAAALRENEELRAYVAELEETQAMLAYSAPLHVPHISLKARVLEDMRAERKIVAMPPRTDWIPWALAASLTVSCGLLWNERRHFDHEHRATVQELASARAMAKTERDLAAARIAEAEEQNKQSLASLQQEVAALRARDELAVVKIQTLSAQVDAYAKALAVVVWDETTQSGVLKLDKFPQVAEGKDYQLWIIDPNRKTPVSAGIVPVGQSGTVRVAFKPKEHVDAVQKFAISVEHAGGSPAPAGQIVELGN